jgi:hypothetical protein
MGVLMPRGKAEAYSKDMVRLQKGGRLTPRQASRLASNQACLNELLELLDKS